MKRSNSTKYTKPRFGRHVSTIGAKQRAEDMRLERLRMLAMIAQQGGGQSAQLRIMARRMAQGKRV